MCAASEPPISQCTVPLWRTIVLAAAAVLAVYLPFALSADFLLTFDDNLLFAPGPNNPLDRGLAAIFDPTLPIANVYLPIAHGSLWLDYVLGGGGPLLPHLVSLLWHIAAVVLLVRLCLECGQGAVAAHLVGGLFALHPALAESVAWVSGRKELTSAVFVFAALLFARRYARRPRASLLLLIACLQALAMYSKATAMIAPALALLVVAFASSDRRRWLAPLVLGVVTLPILLHHQAIATAQGTMLAAEPWSRLPQVPGAFVHYLATTLWPTGLNVLYPEVQTLERFRAALPWALPIVLASAAAVVVCLLRKSWRPVGLGMAAFVVALLPFNTAFPASAIAAADRYLYLAVPFAAMALVAALQRCLPARGVVLLVALLLLPLAFASFQRAKVFRSDETLWRDSLRTDADNAVAHWNLVQALLRGRVELGLVRQHLQAASQAARYPIHALRAEQLLTRVLLLDADYGGAAVHARAAIAAAERLVASETAPAQMALARGHLVAAQIAAIEPLRLGGDADGAQACYRAAAALVPDHPQVVAFAAMQELDAAVAALRDGASAGGAPRLSEDDPRFVATMARLQQAHEQHPESSGVLCAMAQWYRAADRALPALRCYGLATAAEPDRIDGWLGAAKLLREREQFPQAEGYARRGLAQREDPALRQELALALVGQGRLDDAVAQLEAYLRVSPHDKDAAKVLANVLVVQAYARLTKQEASHDDVLAMVARALSLNPQEMKGHLVLGRVRREQRRFADAVAHLEQAHRLLPGYDEARDLLVQSLVDLGYEHRLRGEDDAAAEAWLRCREVSAASVTETSVGVQLQAIWRQREARGVERLGRGDLAGAIADFRMCLRIDPQQQWAAWLLAQALSRDDGADLAELQALCRRAVAWQLEHGLDRSQQVYLLAATLQRQGVIDEARQVAIDYLAAPDETAKAPVIAALQKFAAQ